MTKRKTHRTEASVDAFIDSIMDESRRVDCRAAELMKSATGQEPRMWGTSIIGFGTRHYRYANGKPAELCKVGFAPRSRSFAFYGSNFPERAQLIERLGKYRFSGSCLHVSRLADVDVEVLTLIVKEAYQACSGEATGKSPPLVSHQPPGST